MASWILAIDFGTTSTAAARRVGDRVETIEIEGAPRMPSMVFWREETGGDPSAGRLVLGQEAEELSALAPWCLERAPKRRLGDEFMQLGEMEFLVVDVIAQILRRVMDEALSLSGGAPPSEVRLTHPVRWGKHRLETLRQAARIAGIIDPVLVPEPVAAAIHFASEKLAVGEHVAVYDLGGGTFDTAVLERTEGSFVVIGRPGGEEELGGEDFDDLLYQHLGEQLEEGTWQALRGSDVRRERVWAQANREFLRHARRAKEGLSRTPDYEFYMAPPIDQELHANAPELEQLIAKDLRHTVVELERTVLAAGLKPSDMAAIYMAGGSSRIPLVGRLIQEHLGMLPEHLDDPKAVIALGAARLAEFQPTPEAALETTPKPGEIQIQDSGETIPAPLPGEYETQPPGPGQPTVSSDPTRSPAPGETRPAERPAPVGLTEQPGAQATRDRRPRPRFNGKVAGVVAGSFLVLALIVVAGVALTGGDDNSTGGDDNPRSTADVAAEARAFEGWNCQNSPSRHGIEEGRVCTPAPSGDQCKVSSPLTCHPDEVVLTSFSSKENLDEKYQSVTAKAANDEPCSQTNANGKGPWPPKPATPIGNLICYSGNEGANWIWTYSDSKLLVEAQGDVDPSDLFVWWGETASQINQALGGGPVPGLTDQDDGAQPTRLTKVEFRQSGDDSCRKLQARTRYAMSKYPGDWDAVRYATYRANNSEANSRRLEALENVAPVSFRDPFSRYLEELRKVHERDRQALQAAKRGKIERMEAIFREISSNESQALKRELADDIGFDVCSPRPGE